LSLPAMAGLLLSTPAALSRQPLSSASITLLATRLYTADCWLLLTAPAVQGDAAHARELHTTCGRLRQVFAAPPPSSCSVPHLLGLGSSHAAS
jgi:hypothetical protein